MNSLRKKGRGKVRLRINEPGSGLSICDCFLSRYLRSKVAPHALDWIMNQPSHNHSSPKPSHSHPL